MSGWSSDVCSSDLDSQAFGEISHLFALEMIDGNRHADAAQFGDQLCRLFDGLSARIVRLKNSGRCAPASADDGCTGLAQGRGDSASGAPRRPGNYSHSPAKCVRIRCPRHCSIVLAWIASFKSERDRSEEHPSELQSLMSISYAVFCLKKTTLAKNNNNINISI